jgi:hypothetical protein
MKKTNYSGKKREELIKALMDQREVLRNFQFGEAGSKTRNVKGFEGEERNCPHHDSSQCLEYG